MPNTTTFTFREAVQKLQMDADTINRKIGGLRDESPFEQKQKLNKLRRLFLEVWDTFSDIDNSITQGEADMEIEGKY